MASKTRSLNASCVLRIPEDGPVLLQFNDWSDADISHAFTTRNATRDDLDQLDMMSHPDANSDRIERSRTAVRTSDSIPNLPIVRPEQVHGGSVHWYEPDPPENEQPDVTVIPDVDGVLTRSNRVVLMAHSADCPIVFLYSEGEQNVAGLLHASWKGISHGIPRAGVRNIIEQTPVSPSDLRAGISPSIRACCYEVQSDFESIMLEREPITRPCFLDRDNKRFFDLQQAIQLQLEDAGLPSENVLDSGLCSFCRDDLFYSYRKNGASTGRTAGLISL